MIFYRGIFIITWLFRGALSLSFLCPLVVTHCYLFPSCGCFGRLCWLYCSSARLLRLYFCVGCFGRLCWLYCSSARSSLYYFALWLFRSPVLVELSFRTLSSLVFCTVVVSVAFVGCTVLPHPFSVLFVRCGCFGRLCWLYCSSARSSRCIAPLFRLLAFLPRLSLSILSFVLIW